MTREIADEPRRWPSWKMNTSAPKVAVRLSVFSTIALTGRNTLRVSHISITNVVIAMIAKATGSRCMIASLPS